MFGVSVTPKYWFIAQASLWCLIGDLEVLHCSKIEILLLFWMRLQKPLLQSKYSLEDQVCWHHWTIFCSWSHHTHTKLSYLDRRWQCVQSFCLLHRFRRFLESMLYNLNMKRRDFFFQEKVSQKPKKHIHIWMGLKATTVMLVIPLFYHWAIKLSGSKIQIISVLYPSICNVMYAWLTSPLWGFSGPMKQNEQVKNPNWQEAGQFTVYKCSQGVEPGNTWIKSSWRSVRDLNLGSTDLQSSTLTTWPPCLLCTKKFFFEFYLLLWDPKDKSCMKKLAAIMEAVYCTLCKFEYYCKTIGFSLTTLHLTLTHIQSPNGVFCHL